MCLILREFLFGSLILDGQRIMPGGFGIRRIRFFVPILGLPQVVEGTADPRERHEGNRGGAPRQPPHEGENQRENQNKCHQRADTEQGQAQGS